MAPLMLAAAALPCAAQAQDDAGYPVREVLMAFATACSGVEDTAVNLASAEAAGWEHLADDADTPVSQLMRRGVEALEARSAAGGANMPELIAGGGFRKQVAGRTLYLAVSGARFDGVASRGCRLYDFEAPRGVTAEELEGWAARAPDDFERSPEGATRATFAPGLKPGHAGMEANFVPPGTEPMPEFSVSGITLVASAVDF